MREPRRSGEGTDNNKSLPFSLYFFTLFIFSSLGFKGAFGWVMEARIGLQPDPMMGHLMAQVHSLSEDGSSRVALQCGHPRS